MNGQLLHPMWAVHQGNTNYTSSMAFNFETPTYVVAHTSLTSVETFVAGNAGGQYETLSYWAGAKSGVIQHIRMVKVAGVEAPAGDFASPQSPHSFVFGPDTVSVLFYMEATAGECSGVASVYVW